MHTKSGQVLEQFPARLKHQPSEHPSSDPTHKNKRWVLTKQILPDEVPSTQNCNKLAQIKLHHLLNVLSGPHCGHIA